LVTKIPDEVSYQEASFAVIGAIALHSVRLANPTFGETFVVVGLGLVGQITTDILKANGCKVIAFDFDQSKVELAKQNNITAFTVDNNTDVVKIVTNYTKNIGADGVIITASTKSDEVISQAANMCRKKGRVILTGVVGLNLKRSDFYEKEISFQVSCSYGPGRHDTNYEQNGNDYPIFYVRWTEQRNFDSFLQAISQKIINVKRLISEEIDLEEFYKVYDHLESSRSIA
ncbi:zinc-binding alcohol dehydrogenase, partial [Thermococcus sp. M36]|uniref:zinc-dependent alcohol dehydrogenase n=1 Tax=Thermococcus sp. M36 TaxID=1638261 RepID=UPI00143C89EA